MCREWHPRHLRLKLLREREGRGGVESVTRWGRGHGTCNWNVDELWPMNCTLDLKCVFSTAPSLFPFLASTACSAALTRSDLQHRQIDRNHGCQPLLPSRTHCRRHRWHPGHRSSYRHRTCRGRRRHSSHPGTQNRHGLVDILRRRKPRKQLPSPQFLMIFICIERHLPHRNQRSHRKARSQSNNIHGGPLNPK